MPARHDPISLPPRSATPWARRAFLGRAGLGFGGLALAQMLGTDRLSARADGAPTLRGHLHHPARAKQVIQLFMNGGASQMDLFDYKPALEQRHGEAFDPGGGARVEAATSEPGTIMRPVFPFRRHGACGRWVSDVLPHLAGCVDDMAFLMAMTSRTNVHGPASYLMNTGFLLPGFPSMGAWISYALGRLGDNLPTFVALPDANGFPYNQKGNFSAGFLPASHQGTVIQSARETPIPFLARPEVPGLNTSADQAGLDLLHTLDSHHAASRPDDPLLQARIESYELAARMQLAAPEAFDVDRESPATRALYGLDDPVTADFARRCLIARRLVERGVRFVQVWSGAGGPTGNWDNHGSISKELPPMAAATDRPTAALLHDLQALGLLEDTVVLWNTEFGRMPFTQGSDGRDHNGGTFVGWMAGAGIRGGTAHGQSDEWSWKAAENPVSTHDFHATVLHLLGIDHERLTFRHDGADRRLTDVHGHVVHSILA